ncbi:MAG: TIGR03087 family PEP-CTERM/XrtA system glycosyltransferase [Motiliproteus sp.]
MRPAVLFLTHRIPYPPDKGDKIRSYHLLLELNRHYEVHLGCFIDDSNDWQYLDTLQAHCASICCLPLSKFKRYFKAMLAVVSGKPITLPLYRSHRLRRWVNKTVKHHNINKVVVFSGAMSQYVDSPAFEDCIRVVDFVDVDSDKWAQYAAKKTGLSRIIYQREQRLLQAYEQRIAETFNASLFVSEQEAEVFRSTFPNNTTANIDFFNNGVDSDFFDPNNLASTPTISRTRYIVFTGAMDYWANVDAVCWFCSHVWPQLSNRYPELEFFIVGSGPTPVVSQLTQHSGVRVTGRVEDVRPYIDQAALVVAPLQIARGIQNKVLEAMAMAKPIIATSMAIEGIPIQPELAIQVADSPQAFIDACLVQLKHTSDEANDSNRRWIKQHFNWQHTLKKLPQLLKGEKTNHNQDG